MGFLLAWTDIIKSLYASRELVWRLFLRDFSVRYRQSLFGVLWAVLNPLITMGVFVYLNKSGLFQIASTTVPYPAFALVGLSVWTIFATGLTACSNSIVNAGVMVTKINFPKASLVISSMGQAIVDFVIRLIITALVFVAFGVMPAWTAVFLPVMVAPLVLLTLGVGLFLSLLNGLFRDTVNVVNLIATFLLLLVPVLYPAPESGIVAAVNAWNPLSHIIVACRDIVFIGTFSDPAGFAASCGVSVLLFLVSLRFFYIVEPKIAERI